MKIKRVFAPDIRQAMKMVREQLGPDAVILSNRKVDDGVEIVAAQDFDERSISDHLQDTSELVKDDGNHLTNSRGFTLAESNGGAKAVGDSEQTNKDRNPAVNGAVQRSSSSNGDNLDRLADQTTDAPENPNQNSDFLRLHREIQQMKQLLDTRLTESTAIESAMDNPIRLDCLRHFSAWGFSRSVSMEIASRVNAGDDSIKARRNGMDSLAARIPVWKNNLDIDGGVMALVGPTGVGKTTTVAKLAAGFRLKHGADQVALISIDNYRIGAFEHLNIYGRILGVPVRNASTPEQLQSLLDGYADKRLVLIDTAGMGHRDMAVNRQCSFLKRVNSPMQIHLVISSAAQYKVMKEVVEAFKGFQPDAGILTKLDESALLGPALSAVVEAGLPLSYITDGQKVPEDIAPAYPKILVERCFEENFLENEQTNYGETRSMQQNCNAQSII